MNNPDSTGANGENRDTDAPVSPLPPVQTQFALDALAVLLVLGIIILLGGLIAVLCGGGPLP